MDTSMNLFKAKCSGVGTVTPPSAESPTPEDTPTEDTPHGD